MWRQIGTILALMPLAARADSLVAVRTLPAQTVIEAADLTLVDADIAGALGDATLAVGQELRITVYAGRPIRARDIGPPALVDRNQVVTLVYRASGLTISAEGRALQRGAMGETVRAMNLASKTTVSGVVAANGSIIVGDQN